MRVPPPALSLLVLLGACTVGPDMKRPQVAGAGASWSGSVEAANEAAVDLEPWRVMNDPLLAELVTRAASANLDLVQAQARLREARAARDAVAGRALPQLAAQASATEQQLSENGQLPIGKLPGIDRKFSLFDAGFDASWEVDLWGANRRATEAAGHRAAVAEAEQREMRVRVIAEVVRTYAELRGAQAEAVALGAEADAQRRIAALVRRRYEAGEAARFDDAHSQAKAHAAEAAMPGVRSRIDAAAHALALLAARPPEALLDRLLTPAPVPHPPEMVAAGLRSDMLRRRPDIAAAEARLRAATADAGVEKANLFPRFSLIGSVGQQARGTDDLVSGGSTRFQIGPALHWPIFSGGSVRARIRAANARMDGAAAAYEQAVLGALADSETAINRYAAAVATARDLKQARAASATARSLAEKRYRAGEDDLIMLLDASARHEAAVRAAVAAEAAVLAAHAALVKALGGGWSEGAVEPGSVAPSASDSHSGDGQAPPR